MLIPVFILFVAASAAWLAAAIPGRRETWLLALNVLWWLGSFVSACLTWLAWQDRGYSENWAMIGFMFVSLPYIAAAGIMAGLELFFIRKWQGGKARTIRLMAAGLLVFLALQLAAGLMSA